jgi:hypothetical protein
MSAHAEGATVYPEDDEFTKTLTFSALSDYAVDGNRYAFAEGNQIFVCENATLESYTLSDTVLSLDTDGGEFFYSTKSGTYKLFDNSVCEHEFQYTTDTTLSGFNYYFDDDGLLTIYNKANKSAQTLEGTFSNLKVYSQTIYAMSDNVLYSFDGFEKSAVVLQYADYTATVDIFSGTIKDGLKDYKLTFVTLDAGTYVTEINLKNIGDTINSDGTAKTLKTSEKQTALLLCYSGNAAVISVGDTSYITLKSKVKESTFAYADDCEYSYATVTSNRIYASPFVVDGTAALDNAQGLTVKVKNKLSYENVLGYTFYEVEYTDGDTTKTGYVAKGFLTEYIFEDNEEPTEVPDKNYSESNDVKTVLLVLGVVILVLIAVAYIGFVITRQKNREAK